jgi:hypothetical protein
MKLHLHPLYKRLLLILLVAGPFFWLVFTEDGQRRTDLLLLRLTGKPEINLAAEHLAGSMREADIRALFPDLKLRCEADENPFGNRVCTADIGAFDRIPARALSLYLAGHQLRAVKVSYRRAYHRALTQRLEGRLGPPGGRSEAGVPAAAKVASWGVADGVLLLPAGHLDLNEEAALLWVSAAALQQGVRARSKRPATAGAAGNAAP